jgi:hypothetical protein
MVGRRDAEVHEEGAGIETEGESTKLDLVAQRADGSFVSILGPGMAAYGLRPRHSFPGATPEDVIASCERFLKLRKDLAFRVLGGLRE